MREGVSYTVTLNFVMTFVIIVFTLLSATLIYYKSNKAGNIVVSGIEKYEGYNTLSEDYIRKGIISLGYDISPINCPNSIIAKRNDTTNKCNLVTIPGKGNYGYCVYLCNEGTYYYYRVRTSMRFNWPLIGGLFNLPIYANTNRMYDFERAFGS